MDAGVAMFRPLPSVGLGRRWHVLSQRLHGFALVAPPPCGFIQAAVQSEQVDTSRDRLLMGDIAVLAAGVPSLPRSSTGRDDEAVGAMTDDGDDDDYLDATDIDDVDLDLVIAMTRIALDRMAREPLAMTPAVRTELEEHGRPAVAMLDGVEPLDLAALRHHVSFLGDSPKIARIVLGPDDASALEAVTRARALQVNRTWGRDDPRGDS